MRYCNNMNYDATWRKKFHQIQKDLIEPYASQSPPLPSVLTPENVTELIPILKDLEKKSNRKKKILFAYLFLKKTFWTTPKNYWHNKSKFILYVFKTGLITIVGLPMVALFLYSSLRSDLNTFECLNLTFLLFENLVLIAGVFMQSLWLSLCSFFCTTKIFDDLTLYAIMNLGIIFFFVLSLIPIKSVDTDDIFEVIFLILGFIAAFVIYGAFIAAFLFIIRVMVILLGHFILGLCTSIVVFPFFLLSSLSSTTLDKPLLTERQQQVHAHWFVPFDLSKDVRRDKEEAHDLLARKKTIHQTLFTHLVP